jgi:hypothetical protein
MKYGQKGEEQMRESERVQERERERERERGSFYFDENEVVKSVVLLLLHRLQFLAQKINNAITSIIKTFFLTLIARARPSEATLRGSALG